MNNTESSILLYVFTEVQCITLGIPAFHCNHVQSSSDCNKPTTCAHFTSAINDEIIAVSKRILYSVLGMLSSVINVTNMLLFLACLLLLMTWAMSKRLFCTVNLLSSVTNITNILLFVATLVFIFYMYTNVLLTLIFYHDCLFNWSNHKLIQRLIQRQSMRVFKF